MTYLLTYSDFYSFVFISIVTWYIHSHVFIILFYLFASGKSGQYPSQASNVREEMTEKEEGK